MPRSRPNWQVTIFKSQARLDVQFRPTKSHFLQPWTTADSIWRYNGWVGPTNGLPRPTMPTTGWARPWRSEKRSAVFEYDPSTGKGSPADDNSEIPHRECGRLRSES